VRTAPKVFAAGIMTGALIVAGTIVAAPGKADITPNDVSIYAVAVCGALDDEASVATVVGLGLALGSEGYSGYDAGQIIALAVMTRCPEYEPVLRRFAEIFAEDQVA
jgi:hypothetical protein